MNSDSGISTLGSLESDSGPVCKGDEDILEMCVLPRLSFPLVSENKHCLPLWVLSNCRRQLLTAAEFHRRGNPSPLYHEVHPHRRQGTWELWKCEGQLTLCSVTR